MGARIRAFAEGAFGLLTNLFAGIGRRSSSMSESAGAGGPHHLGYLLLVTTYLAQLYGPSMTIGDKVIGLQSSLASMQVLSSYWTRSPR